MALFYKGSYSLFSNFVFKRKGFLPFKTLFRCLLCGVIFSRPPFLSLQIPGLSQPWGLGSAGAVWWHCLCPQTRSGTPKVRDTWSATLPSRNLNPAGGRQVSNYIIHFCRLQWWKERGESILPPCQTEQALWKLYWCETWWGRLPTRNTLDPSLSCSVPQEAWPGACHNGLPGSGGAPSERRRREIWGWGGESVGFLTPLPLQCWPRVPPTPCWYLVLSTPQHAAPLLNIP